MLRGHRTLQHPSQPPACRRRGRRPQGADGGRGQVPPRALLLHAGDLLQRRAADPRRARLCARFAAPRLARGGGAGDSRRSERHHRPRTARLAVDQSRRPGARHARRGDGPQGPSAAFRGQQAGQPLERRREMAGCGRCGQSRDRKGGPGGLRPVRRLPETLPAGERAQLRVRLQHRILEDQEHGRQFVQRLQRPVPQQRTAARSGDGLPDDDRRCGHDGQVRQPRSAFRGDEFLSREHVPRQGQLPGRGGVPVHGLRTPETHDLRRAEARFGRQQRRDQLHVHPLRRRAR